MRNGGIANLAETDELIGAERYVLKNVKDLETARRFLSTVERFKERVGWHGHTAEDNPSGGNNFRGLYNISIKSIGAARKKDPDVRIDHVIEYAERMREGGFYFMDSPGNDLESVAGQVASGANMIFFTTGNGSITNFPFVPTIKVVTTTGRYDLLSKDMDVNAGAYLDGTPMDDLGREMFERTLHGRLGREDRRRARGPLPGLHLARLEADERREPGRAQERPRAGRRALAREETRTPLTSSSPSRRSRPDAGLSRTRSGSSCRRACARARSHAASPTA